MELFNYDFEVNATMKIDFDKIDAVIFDMDGSLVDSMWMWRAIDQKFLEDRGIEYSTQVQKDLEGLSFTEAVGYFQTKFNLDESFDSIADSINGMAKDIYEYGVTYKPGAREFLEFIKEKGIKTGIATSNSKELVEACDKNLGLSEYIDEIHTTDEVARSKPYPDIYIYIAELLDADPMRCVVFEDILPGISAGLDARMTVVAVEDEYSMEIKDKKKRMAHGYITDYRELL